jgi:hypothetical protein
VSVASDLRTLLLTLGYPVAQGTYTGTATTYITFNYTTNPECFAGDVPDAEVYLIQVHLIAPATLNTTTLQKTIKDLLANAGYIYPSMVPASDDPAEQHLVFETETDVGI